MSFAVGSDILYDHIKEDMTELSSLPAGTHIGQLSISWLNDSLPKQFLMYYDYEFLYRMKCSLCEMRMRAKSNAPMTAHSVMETGYIYGYDWLETEEAQERKQLIKKNPVEFLYFTKPTNKGAIQTAEMLIEARNEEELAAIWIAATARELSEYRLGNSVGRYANMLHMAACEFLKTQYFLWHHAMKKLVPDIMIPLSVLENVVCEDAEPVMGLIQMNTVFLKSTWTILRYSSLKDGESPESHYRISPE